jgi:hypothetical protein
MTGHLQSLRQLMYILDDYNIKIWIRPRFLGHKQTSANSDQASPCNEVTINHTSHIIRYLERRYAEWYIHGVIYQKTEMFITTAVRTSNCQTQFAVIRRLTRRAYRSQYVSWHRQAPMCCTKHRRRHRSSGTTFRFYQMLGEGVVHNVLLKLHKQLLKTPATHYSQRMYRRGYEFNIRGSVVRFIAWPRAFVSSQKHSRPALGPQIPSYLMETEGCFLRIMRLGVALALTTISM